MTSPDNLMQHYTRLRAKLHAALEGLTDDQRTERTLDGWSVKDHLTHIAFWDELRASDIERISAGHETACRITDEQCQVLNDINHSMFADCSLEQAWWELERTHQLVLNAISNATPRGLEPAHYAECGLQSDHEAEHIGWIETWRQRQGY